MATRATYPERTIRMMMLEPGERTRLCADQLGRVMTLEAIRRSLWQFHLDACRECREWQWIDWIGPLCREGTRLGNRVREAVIEVAWLRECIASASPARDESHTPRQLALF